MGDATEENYLHESLLHTKQVKKIFVRLFGGGFVMGDSTEENYLPGPRLDTKQVQKTIFVLAAWRWFRHGRRNRGELPALSS